MSIRARGPPRFAGDNKKTRSIAGYYLALACLDSRGESAARLQRRAGVIKCDIVALSMSDSARALLHTRPRVVSLGLPIFAQDLTRLAVPVVHAEWRPPAAGDPRLLAALERLEQRREIIERANAEALARLAHGEPVLVDCRPAWEALGRSEERRVGEECRSRWSP